MRSQNDIDFFTELAKKCAKLEKLTVKNMYKLDKQAKHNLAMFILQLIKERSDNQTDTNMLTYLDMQAFSSLDDTSEAEEDENGDSLQHDELTDALDIL